MFEELKNLKPNLEKTIRMWEKTFRDALNHLPGNVSFRALPPSDVDFYAKLDLTKYNFETDIEQYAFDLCSMLSESFSKRKAIDDNMLPTVSPVLGIGDYSAFVGGEILFQPETSWSKPLLKEITDYQKLPPLGQAKWYKKFLDICEALLKRSASSGIPFMRGFFSPLDLAAALRGDAIYFDFYDNPEELRGLLDYCADATIRFAEDIYALADKYLKDTPYGMWYLKGNINMSEDIACMISGELYREFCAPYTQKVIDHFGRGHLHSHSRALYLVKEICALKNVTHLWLATDPNQPRPIDHIEQLAIEANGVCLAIDCDSFEEIEKNIHKPIKGNFSLCLPVKSVEEGVYYTDKFNRLIQGVVK